MNYRERKEKPRNGMRSICSSIKQIYNNSVKKTIKLGHFHFFSGNKESKCSLIPSNERKFSENGATYKYIDYFCIYER